MSVREIDNIYCLSLVGVLRALLSSQDLVDFLHLEELLLFFPLSQQRRDIINCLRLYDIDEAQKREGLFQTEVKLIFLCSSSPNNTPK